MWRNHEAGAKPKPEPKPKPRPESKPESRPRQHSPPTKKSHVIWFP